MQVLNAKRGAITFKLGKELMTILPGKVSKTFVGDAVILRTILTLGNPNELGIIINSPYEYDSLNEVSAAQAYLFRNVEEAKARLLEGKSFEAPKEGPMDIEYNKLKKIIEEKELTIKELTEKCKQLESDLSNAPIEKYKMELDLSIRERAALDGQLKELEERVKNVEQEKVELKIRFDALEKECEGLKSANNDLDAALKSAKDGEGALAELQDKFDKLTAEHKELQDEGSKLLKNYETMKAALKELCQITGYSMVDGNWVKSGN